MAAITVAVYLPVSNHDFIEYDDQDYVTQNSHVQAGLSWAGLVWAFSSGDAGNWHPVTWLSHMLDVQLFGLNPGAHHLVNLGLHVLNSILLLLLLHRLTGSPGRSGFVAALFALHPLHVESVAWVSERKDVLSALFFLLTLSAYARFARPGSGEMPRPKRFFGLALVFFALGLMSKPMLVSVPAVLLLIDFWPLERWAIPAPAAAPAASRPASAWYATLKRNWPLLREKIPFVGLSAVSCVVTIIAQRGGGAFAAMEHLSFLQRVDNVLVSYVRYIRKIFWPSDLAVFYPHPGSWPAWVVLLSGLFLAGITIAAWHGARKARWFFVGWLWFLIMLLPVIGLLQVGLQSIADRYTYLPSIGLFIAVTWGIGQAVKNAPSRIPVAGGALAILALLTTLTGAQARSWKNTETLFTRALAVTSKNALAEYTLGAAQARAGKLDEAFKHLSEAVRIQPSHGEALNNLGLILVLRGQTEEGIASYRKALQSGLDIAALHYNLASALATRSKLEEAAAEYRAALNKDPAFDSARCELGMTLLRLGQVTEAKNELQIALQHQQRNPDALVGMGAALAAEANYDEAFAWFGKALEMNPSNPQAHFELGCALLDAGKEEEAQSHLSWAAQSRADLPQMLFQRAQEFATRGNLPAALARAQAASRLAPNDAAIHQVLASWLMRTQQIDWAIEHFRAVVRLRGDARAHFNLASALALQGKIELALSHYRDAVRLQPDWPVALNDLAWALATAPKPELRNGAEAVRLAQRAVELTGAKEALYLGTLDACYAEAGRFEEAKNTAVKARELALASGQKEIAEAAENRLKLYETGRPFRQP